MGEGIQRFSSRRTQLGRVYLADRLKHATSYKRIAGYFRSSIFELVGEEIAAIPEVRIVCNSELDPRDLEVGKAARDAALKGKWNETTPEVEALLYRDRYRKLYDLLTSGRVKIRVVPRDLVFLHGKAGVIEGPRGKIAFLGSINESRAAFEGNYEILWEDPSPEGVAWVEEEFDALWERGVELPDAILTEIKRVADRIEVAIEESGLAAADVPAAVLVESPLYRGGEQLQPWQRSFVARFLEDRETFGMVRLLLADEVGLGKTLSLAASALVGAILDDGPVLILCPATLTLQWQAELKDRLGVPSAVWHSTKKSWIDPEGHVIKTRGAVDVVKCPFQIAIVSTGLVMQGSEERDLLLKFKNGRGGGGFSTVVLDEAHKARKSGGFGKNADEPNNLMDFMLKIAHRTRHLLLGTATPIQTDVGELWGLMEILHQGTRDHGSFILGQEPGLRIWADKDRSLPFMKGDKTPDDEREAWELIRNPLPPSSDGDVALRLRQQLDADSKCFYWKGTVDELPYLARSELEYALEPGYFKEHNPIVRHTVLRKRKKLEEEGLIQPIGVEIHPSPGRAEEYPRIPMQGLGLMTNQPFNLAYEAAVAFTEEYKKRNKSAGFMKSLLLQRICSSFAAGANTAKKLLESGGVEGLLEDDDGKSFSLALEGAVGLTQSEVVHLRRIVSELSREEARDPKLEAARRFLLEYESKGKRWLDLGCILFSQYYDTAEWVADHLAEYLPQEPIAIYAGADRSRMYREGKRSAVNRDSIKQAVKDRHVRLVVATDAACEGLNLQTLGTLVNFDLPWNPARLEQRLGRIKRFGQSRKSVDMLNLVYHETQDERVYEVLSKRMKDKYDIFGGLPDTIRDEWIESEQELEEQMDTYIHLRQKARDAFELRYQTGEDAEANRWEACSKVFSRRDVVERLSRGW